MKLAKRCSKCLLVRRLALFRKMGGGRRRSQCRDCSKVSERPYEDRRYKAARQATAAKRAAASIFQRLYDSEINCGIQSFWDAGWSAWIGDDLNGRPVLRSEFQSLADVATWLEEQARKLYPKSAFALTR